MRSYIARHSGRDTPFLFQKSPARHAGAVTLVLLAVLALYGGVVSLPMRADAATIRTVADSTAAGYIANFTSSGGSVDDLKGFWTVPNVQSSSESVAVLESIGIGSDDTIIEIGTSQVSNHGAIVYTAWYWVSPEGGATPVQITKFAGEVGPDKVIAAEIRRVMGDTWALGLFVGTRSGFTDSFTTTATHAVGLPVASWLVQPVPDITLANFGSASFFGTNATINGTQSRLDQLDNKKLNLFDSSFQCMLAYTGDIDPNAGDVFIVSFLQAAPPCSPQNVPKLNLVVPIVVGSALVIGVIIVLAALVIVSGRRKKAHGQSTGWPFQPAPQPVTPSKTCAKCQSALMPGARFCDICGTPVS